MEKTVTFTVSEMDRGKRLDHFVKEQTVTLSRSRIQQLIEEGRFLVNGRTGEVQGERPWSAVKIALAILAGLAAVGLLILFIRLRQ